MNRPNRLPTIHEDEMAQAAAAREVLLDILLN